MIVMEETQFQKSIILFDGVCNLCNGFVQFVLKHEKDNHFHFAALQSEFAQALLNQYHLDQDLKTVIYISNNKAYTRSNAALHIAKGLKAPFNWAQLFLVIPSFIRNRIYDWIAKNRYLWFGKQEHCMVPTPDLRSRFLG